MKKIKDYLRGEWVPIVTVGIGVVLLATLLWFRLGSLTFGKAADIELATKLSSGSWQTILENPLNAPYTVVQWLVNLTGHHGITSLRLISTVFAALAAFLFYVVARQWHSLRAAMLASWLFISSAWFLHTARLGSPEILWIISILAIVVVLTPHRDDQRTLLALPLTLLALSAVLYVPGMVWLVLAGVIWRRKNFKEAWQAARFGWLRAASILAAVIALAPLVYGLIRSPVLALQWIGLPANSDGAASFPPISVILQNLLSVPQSLLLYSKFDAAHWLGNLPLLSAFEIIMLIVGVYFYITHHRAARTRMIMVLTAIAWLLVGISGPYAISLIVPVVYLLLAAGIAYILHLWLRVFPRNPIARGIGISLVMLAVLLTSVYQTRSYFVAWRYHPETRAEFSHKL